MIYLQFEVPGLLIQWEAVFSQGDGGEIQLAKGVCEAIQQWYTYNPCGRVIILHEGASTIPGSMLTLFYNKDVSFKEKFQMFSAFQYNENDTLYVEYGQILCKLIFISLSLPQCIRVSCVNLQKVDYCFLTLLKMIMRGLHHMSLF